MPDPAMDDSCSDCLGDPQVTPRILRMPILSESGVCGVRDFADLTAFAPL